MKGLFGGFFDLNHDGKMSFFERGLELMMLEELEKEEKQKEILQDDLDWDLNFADDLDDNLADDFDDDSDDDFDDVFGVGFDDDLNDDFLF